MRLARLKNFCVNAIKSNFIDLIASTTHRFAMKKKSFVKTGMLGTRGISCNLSLNNALGGKHLSFG